MNPSDFASARDLFEAAWDACKEIERSNETLRELEAMEGMRGANVAGVGHASGIGDPYRTTDARMDYESRVRATIAEDEALIDYACSVLYGRDQQGRTGGLYTLAPHVCADAICLHWCMGMKWEQVSQLQRYSVSHLKDKAAQGFDVIDAYGIEATIDGVGDAT